MSKRGDHFRGKATRLRAMAETAPDPDMARELWSLADRYERLADHADIWAAALHPAGALQSDLHWRREHGQPAGNGHAVDIGATMVNSGPAVVFDRRAGSAVVHARRATARSAPGDAGNTDRR